MSFESIGTSPHRTTIPRSRSDSTSDRTLCLPESDSVVCFSRRSGFFHEAKRAKSDDVNFGSLPPRPSGYHSIYKRSWRTSSTHETDLRRGGLSHGRQTRISLGNDTGRTEKHFRLRPHENPACLRDRLNLPHLSRRRANRW